MIGCAIICARPRPAAPGRYRMAASGLPLTSRAGSADMSRCGRLVESARQEISRRAIAHKSQRPHPGKGEAVENLGSCENRRDSPSQATSPPRESRRNLFPSTGRLCLDPGARPKRVGEMDRDTTQAGSYRLPSGVAGSYRLPRTVEMRLIEAVRGLRNAEPVMRLAHFLARFHSAPRTLGRMFPVDRCALAAHAELDLSEAQIRGALATLERLGFVERQSVQGSPYRRTAAGLRRKPTQWRIGAAFAAMFAIVNKIALARRAKLERRQTLVARNQIPAVSVLSGEQVSSPLEQALARLGRAVTS